MNKIKTIKIKNEDGSVSEESYSIAADALNIDMTNGKNVQETIGTIDVDQDGDIAAQLNKKINKSDIIDNLNSSDNNKVLSAKQGKVLNEAVAAANLDIQKKMYYFNTIEDMKEADLQAGDTCQTLGYYEANDGGEGLYRIVDVVSDNTWYEILGNNLYAEYVKKEKENFIKTSFLGLNTIENAETALNNYKIIKKAIEYGYNILFDGYYPIDNININNLISVDRAIELQGISENAGFYKFTSNETFFFDMMEGDIKIENLKIINSSITPISLIQNYTNKLYKKKYGKLYFENCVVEGRLKLLNLHQDNYFEGDETWGASEINIKNCVVTNNFNTFIHVGDMPAKIIELYNNNFHNFKYTILTLSAFYTNDEVQPENANPYGEDLIYNWIDGVIAENNTVINDNSIFGEGQAYHTFIMTKSKKAIVKNNKISGIKANNSDTYISNTYLSGREVIFENNIVENCINFGANSLNVMMKCKDSIISKYLNNTFSIENEWLNQINSNFENSYSEQELKENTSLELIQTININMDYFEINGNIIKIPYYKNSLDERMTAKTFIMKNNILEFNTFENYLINNYSTNENIVFSNNKIYVKNQSTLSGILYTPNDANKGQYIINDNLIEFNSSSIYVLTILKKISSIIACRNIIQNLYENATGGFINSDDIEITDISNFNDNIFKDNGNIRPYRIPINEYFIENKLNYFGKIFNNVSAMNNINIYLPRFKLYTKSIKYKVELSFIDENDTEQKATYVFEIYPNNDKNYVKFLRTNNTVENIDLMTPVSTLTAYNIKSINNINMNNYLCQYFGITGGTHGIRFNYALFPNGIHNVEIVIKEI